jgi:hypothetical protein
MIKKYTTFADLYSLYVFKTLFLGLAFFWAIELIFNFGDLIMVFIIPNLVLALLLTFIAENSYQIESMKKRKDK